MKILQVNTRDAKGGAAAIAWSLFQAYRARGYHSWLAVGRKFTDDPDVLLIPNHELRTHWTRFWLTLNRHLQPLDGKIPGAWRLDDLVRAIADPARWFDEYRGNEDFCFPGTWRLPGLTTEAPDILHLHNLHDSYFDLRALPRLSRQLPVVVTLHDAWLLSGHCSHSFECERWKTGCGQCPDLSIYPAVRRDSTDNNWRRKQAIYATSRLYVATPSRLLMDKVEESILARGVVESRVIPNGVDLTVYHSADKQAARATLGLPQAAKILLFAADSPKKNVFKDFATLKTAVSLASERLRSQNVLFVALGEEAAPERIGQTELRYVPYQKNPQTVAGYYQAADVYIHAAKADTFPNTVLEALACGTPVIATAVGGIPEQVKRLNFSHSGSSRLDVDSYTSDEATGVLVRAGDAEEIAAGVEALLMNESLCHQLSANAAMDARRRFDLEIQANRYLEWYRQILQVGNIRKRPDDIFLGSLNERRSEAESLQPK